MQLVWFKNKPIIGLAPMDGWTDSPFRQICKTQGADLVFSEMIPAPGIIYAKKKIENRRENIARGLINSLYFTEMERPIAIQIFGKKPEEMAQACEILNQGITMLNQKEYRRENIEESQGRDAPVARLKPNEININFGCPAKSAVSSGHGVALMDNPDLAAEIVRECVKSSDLPITIKMRTGWNDSSEAVPFAQKMAQAGAAAIYIHGRTFKQKYTGLADWEKIYEVAKSVDIPVVGNGDINGRDTLQRVSANRLLAGVLIGRAARGNPWIFNKNSSNSSNWTKKVQVILKHAELMYKLKGDHGIIEFRKHLLSYIHGFPGASSLRRKLVQVTTVQQIQDYLTEYRRENRARAIFYLLSSLF